MLILHANWIEHRLLLWAESAGLYRQTVGADGCRPRGRGGAVLPEPQPTTQHQSDVDSTLERSSRSSLIGAHPYALGSSDLRAQLARIGVLKGTAIQETREVNARLALPVEPDAGPLPSPWLARAVGVSSASEVGLTLSDVTVPALSIAPQRTLSVLSRLDNIERLDGLALDDSLHYCIIVGRLTGELLAQQRVVPAMSHLADGRFTGTWRPWLHDENTRERLSLLAGAMPGVFHAGDSGRSLSAWSVLEEMIMSLTDASIRRYLDEHEMRQPVEARLRDGGSDDPHIVWLSGLLGTPVELPVSGSSAVEMMRVLRQWIGRLTDVGQGRLFHLCLVLKEPPEVEAIPDLTVPPDDLRWSLTFHLQASDDSDLRIEAQRIWSLPDDVNSIDGHRIDRPHELMLGELARAAKVFKQLEDALADAQPTQLSLSTDQAYSFMREIRPLLEESGISVVAPSWWDQPGTRLAARLRVFSEEVRFNDGEVIGCSASGGSLFGLDSIVKYSWQIVLGDRVLDIDEFKRLTKVGHSLIRVGGQWVEIRSEDLKTAMTILDRDDGGQITVREALRLAYGSPERTGGLPVLGMDADGWVGRVFGEAAGDSTHMPIQPQPEGFQGTLRPYQVTGLSWMAFLDQFGLGACLADDMGLGKTIQMIALLLHEREMAESRSSLPTSVGPTLLVVPTSVVTNWVREVRRFGPRLKVMVHHGGERRLGEQFGAEARRHDLIITTYALVHRDFQDLNRVPWLRICLDEAQNIKNPATKQSRALRALHADRRVVLTGTPVENRLVELWSIMDFCNPGFLGSSGDFKRRFAVPIERYRDQVQTDQLRALVQPFILRRLKTDPCIIADLPDKLEYKVYCDLTPEQAALYQGVVGKLLDRADHVEGIQRRGLILASLTKLKQICNHPGQFLGERDSVDADATGFFVRSGKTARIIEMLEETLAEGDSSLIFTQFRQMGHLLVSMIQHELDVDVIFLHGGTPTAKRQQMIDRFQERDGSTPVFILSLKAGGLGLNLTAANHVFHFDRWWNPAVENQATDRAFRIGQTRNVQVHKFICSGTIEERIDEMIERKTALADNVIGAGEDLLSDLTTDQLKEALSLRYDYDESRAAGAQSSANEAEPRAADNELTDPELEPAR